jgi:hypothetical protein
VVIGSVPQVGLAFAEELMRKLNERGDPEERRILQ